jgi:predicted TIM-barrel fold metal-dependent hydrolase
MNIANSWQSFFQNQATIYLNRINTLMKNFTGIKLISLLIITCFFENCIQSKSPAGVERKSDPQYYALTDFKTVEKYDAHVHVNTDKGTFLKQAEEDNFRLVTINWDDVNDPPPMEEQQKFALQQIKAFPGRINYATTFSIRNFNNDNWQEQTIAYLKNSFDQGAIAVKIYKVIGMSLRDKNNKLVMIDDSRFDSIINFIVQNNIPVVGHLGEPKNCWIPVEQMTIKGDQSYFTENPKYHMYLHPEFPSYEDQIRARDHMLEKHPDLKFIGAHLGSLEWSVDELAKRLDKFPNMAVDMAARISHLQYQAKINWQKVHDFLIKYQDRLLYATDLLITDSQSDSSVRKQAHDTWLMDWKFFTTDQKMQSSDFDGGFKGLKLPREVIDKIYRANAEAWFHVVIKNKN